MKCLQQRFSQLRLEEENFISNTFQQFGHIVWVPKPVYWHLEPSGYATAYVEMKSKTQHCTLHYTVIYFFAFCLNLYNIKPKAFAFCKNINQQCTRT